MNDGIDIQIPFHELFVKEFNKHIQGNPVKAGFVDSKNYDFIHSQKGVFDDFGDWVPASTDPHSWATLPSSISDVAVGFFPQGMGFQDWPCIRIKASPAKIIQGHNVFGSENPRQGIYEMLTCLRMNLPRIWAHLDIENAEVRYTDVTYSVKTPSKYYRDHVYQVFRHLPGVRQRINDRYDDYLKMGVGSTHKQLKIYGKEQEFLADLKKAERTGKKQRVEIMKDPRLLDWVKDLQRFEATIGPRTFERLGIPTKLGQFLKFYDWFERVHGYSLTQYLWRDSFEPFFRQIEGHTMKDVDDNNVKERIFAYHKTQRADGTFCTRRATAVWKTYRQIKAEGYIQLAKENSSTFFRNVQFLEEAGISRAFLKMLDPHDKENLVIPIVELIRIDFAAQRPDWYEEPVAGNLYKPYKPKLKLVA